MTRCYYETSPTRFQCDNCGTECATRRSGIIDVPAEPGWLRLRVTGWQELEAQCLKYSGDGDPDPYDRRPLELDVCPACVSRASGVVAPGLRVLFEKWSDQ